MVAYPRCRKTALHYAAEFSHRLVLIELLRHMVDSSAKVLLATDRWGQPRRGCS
jgi:hypothetical protein